MGYENAPATKMLATHCAACGRPLVDSLSVEIGMGPDCREKYGYNNGPTENQAEANKVISEIARNRNQAGVVIPGVCALKALGFVRLAEVVETKLSSVHVTQTGSLLQVKTPYSPKAVDMLRQVPGRRWDAANKVNTFPVTAKNNLWAVIRACFPGQLLLGSQGLVYIS
jgi:Family of unknown function (DUF6011)